MTSKQKIPALSKRMRKALAADGPPFGRPKPKADELKAIKHLLKSRGKGQPEISVGKAMRVAVDADPSSETATLINRILADQKMTSGARRQAASLLGELPFAHARNALHKQLAGEERNLEPTLLAALLKIGDAKSIAQIQKLPKTSSEKVQSYRDFVSTAIAYRLGEKPSRVREHAVIPRSIPFFIEPEKPALLKGVLKTLKGSNFGLKLNDKFGLCFDCGGTKHVLLVNDELKRGQFATDLLAKRRLAGVIAMAENDTESFVTRQLIFVKPARGQAVVSVMNTAGEVLMMGSLRRSEDGLELAMRDHVSARVPSNITGLIGDSDVHIKGELFVETPRQKDGGEVDTTVYTN